MVNCGAEQGIMARGTAVEMPPSCLFHRNPRSTLFVSRPPPLFFTLYLSETLGGTLGIVGEKRRGGDHGRSSRGALWLFGHAICGPDLLLWKRRAD